MYNFLWDGRYDECLSISRSGCLTCVQASYSTIEQVHALQPINGASMSGPYSIRSGISG